MGLVEEDIEFAEMIVMRVLEKGEKERNWKKQLVK